MYCLRPGKLLPTARPVLSVPQVLSRPRWICRAAAPAPAAELASAPDGPEMLVRLAQPEDTSSIVHLTRELAQVRQGRPV